MRNWFDDKDMTMRQIMAEDAAAPELRNPRMGGLRGKSLVAALIRTIRG